VETGPSGAQLADWLRSQRAEDKDAWLLGLLGNSAQVTRSGILLQFRQSLRASRDEPMGEAASRRTCQELRAAAKARAEEAECRRAEEVAVRRAKEAEQSAKLRNLELNRLARRVDAAWDEADRKVSTKQAHQYALAVKELTDLRDLAMRDGRVEQFEARLLDLVHRHERKYAFVKRLRKAGLAT
jgi:hypothetical protein